MSLVREKKSQGIPSGQMCFFQCFVTPMTPTWLLAGSLTTLSFRDCDAFKFWGSSKVKIPFDSRQPRVSNETNHVMLPHWKGGYIPNYSKLRRFFGEGNMAITIFQRVPWPSTSIYVNGNGLHGYLQASPIQTYQIYVKPM